MEENEKRTPVFDWTAEKPDFKYDSLGRIKTVTEAEALEQIVLKALQTARSQYVIYFDNEDRDQHNKYGSEVADILVRRELPEEVRTAEVERGIREALIYDPWITDVYEVSVTRTGNAKAEADLKIKTIFDKEIEVKGATL